MFVFVIFLDINLQSFKMKNDDNDNRFQTPSVSENNVSFLFFCLFENFLNLNPHQWIGIIFRFAKSKKQWSIIVVRKVENFLFTRYETKRKFPKRKKIIHRNHHHYYGNLFYLWRKNLNLMNFDLEKKHSFYKLSLMFFFLGKWRKFPGNLM